MQSNKAKVVVSRDGRVIEHLTKEYATLEEAKTTALAINCKAFQPLFAVAKEL